MNKVNILLVVTALVVLFMPGFVRAADLVINCSSVSESCDFNPSGVELFNEDNLVPGNIISKEIDVINDSDDKCNLKLRIDDIQGQSILAEQLLNTISNSSVNNEPLMNLGEVDLGIIGINETHTYTWDVTFNPEAGNAYQNIQTSFDFSLDFNCPEVSDTENNDDSPNGSVLGANDGFGDTTGQVFGAMTKKVSSVLGLKSFPEAGVSFQRFISFFIIGLVALLLFVKFGLPLYTKKSSRR